jgi:hypothetical protein
MNETSTEQEVPTYPAPVLEPWTPPAVPTPIPRDPKWEREYKVFQELLPELLKTHKGQYVAIHEGKVVDSGDDQIVVAKRVWQRFGYVALHVGLVTDRPSLERIPSPREIRDGTWP